ncbi:MAG: HIT domain-containing protein [Candidatus Pacearchaeota archaeon]
MSLTSEQVQVLKKQLYDQIKGLPEEQRKEAEEQIDSMSDSAIEAMLDKQKASQKPIFRAIIAGEIPAKIIDENKLAIAVLDTRPITKGHSIIIPRQEVKDGKNMATQAFTLAKKVAKRTANKLKAKSTEIQTEFKFGEIILNVIPVYDKPVSLNSQRQEIPEPELSELAQLLKAKKRAKSTPKVKKQISSPGPRLPQFNRRVP